MTSSSWFRRARAGANFGALAAFAAAVGCDGGAISVVAADAAAVADGAAGVAVEVDAGAAIADACATIESGRVEVTGSIRFVGVPPERVCSGPGGSMRIDFLAGNVDADRVELGCDGAFRIALWPGETH